MVRRLSLLALLVVSASCCLATPAIAKGFFGVVQGEPFSARDYAKLGKSGAGTVRFGLNWNAVQPRRGTHNWAAIDAKIGQLAALGIRSFPTLSGSPPWISSKPKRPPIRSKREKQAWRGFLSAAVHRYGPGGEYWRTLYRAQHPGKPAVPVTQWQIWNEPSLPKFFPRKHAEHDYAKLVKISDRPIHRADPHAELVLAGLPAFKAPNADKFLGRLYRVKGFKGSFDAAAVHPYAPSMNKFVTAIKRMRQTMKQRGDKRKGLWLTEIGWGSAKNRFSLNKGKRGQKRLLKRSFRVTLHNRHRWRLEGVQWFDLRDPAPGAPITCSFCSSAGLLKHDYGEKPAYRAFQRFAKRH
jgi:hypothetical protein